MAEKEDIIFQIKVEGSDALTEMERFKKSILQTKQEQAELTKAYKAGNITLNEFVKEQVRLEAILKKQQSSYGNLQKSVTGVKTQLDKLIDSNKKISKSFEDTAKEINIAGQNLGGLTTRLASFANPATAAVGIVGALTTAYASSTIGARDLKSAQDQLATSFKLSTNEFAAFVDGLTGGDGSGADGIFSKLAFGFNQFLFGAGNANLSRFGAQKIRELQELELQEIVSKRAAKDALNTAEELRRTRDREDLKLKERLDAAYDVQQFIDERESILVKVQQDKLAALSALLSLDKENLELKKQIKLVEFEIADAQEDSQGKRTEALNGIIKLEKELNQTGDAAGGRKLKFSPGKGTQADAIEEEQKIQDAILDFQINQADKEIRLEEQTEAEKTAINQREAAKRKLIAEAEAEAKTVAAVTVLDSIAGLASEGTEIQKAAALLSIATSTTAAVTKGIEASQSIPFPGNLVAMATTIATILGAIANAKQIGGFAEGGWTGPGNRNQAAGIVHADEYVTPKHIVHAPAAQHHLAALENMRLRGYADGGLVTNNLTSETNQNLVIANMLKRMPAPVLDLQETSYGLNKLKVKVVGDKPLRR